MKKIHLQNIITKFIIVVIGDVKKIVYDLDDERIFSVHITGCGRGAKNTVLSHKTFYDTVEAAQKGIDYLNTCHFTCKFEVITVEQLQQLSPKGYQYLMHDIEDFNDTVDFENTDHSTGQHNILFEDLED